MNYAVTQETFEILASCEDPTDCLNWNYIFSLPDWLDVWWKEFKPCSELYLGAVRRDDKVIGIAPLLLNEGKASFIGNVDVCDYLDFVISPGEENDFFASLFDDLKERGVSSLDLHALRPDSTVLTSLISYAQAHGHGFHCEAEDVSVEMELPPSWEEYLAMLNSKQRHEVKRKLRRLTEAGEVEYRVVRGTEIRDKMDTFLSMFTESRSDKATFLTGKMESFFRSLTESLTESGLLKMGILDLDGKPAAMILYFDYNDTIYLYNCGYDREYESLSVGLLSKVLCIKESIEQGKKKFDFLKGGEVYKYRLGGKEVPIENCLLTIK